MADLGDALHSVTRLDWLIYLRLHHHDVGKITIHAVAGILEIAGEHLIDIDEVEETRNRDVGETKLFRQLEQLFLVVEGVPISSRQTSLSA